MKKLSELIDIKGDEKDDHGIPDHWPVSCCGCDWKGLISDCEKEIDSEGWEYPDYEILICPECGEPIDV